MAETLLEIPTWIKAVSGTCAGMAEYSVIFPLDSEGKAYLDLLPS